MENENAEYPVLVGAGYYTVFYRTTLYSNIKNVVQHIPKDHSIHFNKLQHIRLEFNKL